VGKKEKHCDRSNPDDDEQGDCWDHVAFDPEHRLIVSLVIGRRSEDHSLILVSDFYARTGGRTMTLITTDAYATYASAILEVYGEEVVPERTGKPGRPAQPYKEVPRELTYATVQKEREGGRVKSVTTRVVYGSQRRVASALAALAVGKQVNTSHVERFHGTDRTQNARKVRRTYTFSKDWAVHEAVTTFVRFSYNFCWPVRTLRVRGVTGHWEERTPAMVAGLADHVWSVEEWITFPGVKKVERVT
jgi:IS1 family transposase